VRWIRNKRKTRLVKIKKTIGGLGPDAPGHVTHLHDGGSRDTEESHIVKKQVPEIKMIFFTYKRHEGVYEA